MPHGCRPFHALAGSLPHSLNHSRDSVACPAIWLDSTLWVLADNHNRPRTPVRVATLPQPGEDVWYPPQQDDPHHPAANGLVERLHRTLKAAIMCHADEQWTAALSLVLLGLFTAYKDLQTSAAELVYGETLRVLG